MGTSGRLKTQIGPRRVSAMRSLRLGGPARASGAVQDHRGFLRAESITRNVLVCQHALLHHTCMPSAHSELHKLKLSMEEEKYDVLNVSSFRWRSAASLLQPRQGRERRSWPSEEWLLVTNSAPRCRTVGKGEEGGGALSGGESSFGGRLCGGLNFLCSLFEMTGSTRPHSNG